MSDRPPRAFAVVPARGGSKGLPGKHLRSLGGQSLLAWTVQAAQGSRAIDSFVLTSDDPAILQHGASLGAPTLRRPDELAEDHVRSEPVVAHALAAQQLHGARPDAVVLLQPTSPLRHAGDIDAALAMLFASDADAVVSVYAPPINPWKCFYRDSAGHLRGIVDDDTPFRPRQSLPQAWMPNGAIYAVRTDHFERTGRLFGPKTLAYEMPASRSIDIDVAGDLDVAEAHLEKLSTLPLQRRAARPGA